MRRRRFLARIAGHASTKMTEEYTVVQLRRLDELTRRIQDKLAKAVRKKAPPTTTQMPPTLADAEPATLAVQ